MLKVVSPSRAFLGLALLAGGFALRASAGTVYLAVGNDTLPGQPAGFPYDFGGTNPYQYGDGGEFTAFVTGLPGSTSVSPSSNGGFDLPSGYSPLALRVNPGTSSGYSAEDNSSTYAGDTGFETFCLEDDVDFYVGTAYNYTLGFGIQDPGTSTTSLTAGVAWLYAQFATGNLSGYDYSDDEAHLTDAGQLQSVIWYLEGEVNPSNPSLTSDAYAPAPTVANPFYNDVIAAFGGGAGALAAAEAPVDNLSASYGVEVLELNSGGTPAQDQLVYLGGGRVSDGGSTLILAGLALAGLAAGRRLRPARLT